MSARFGTTVRIALGLAVSAVCLWLAISQAHLGDLVEKLRNVSYWWMLVLAVGNVVALYARGYRWRVLLANRGAVSDYFWAQSVGCLLTNVFPLRRRGRAGGSS